MFHLMPNVSLSTETESSCVSTETDDFELESYLNEAMSKVDHVSVVLSEFSISISDYFKDGLQDTK